MRVPETRWHDVALDESVIKNLEYYVEQNTESLATLASAFPDCFEGETPEMIATHIGAVLHNQSEDKNLCTPIEEDVTGKPGRKLALGFVGAHAMAASDTETVTWSESRHDG